MKWEDTQRRVAGALQMNFFKFINYVSNLYVFYDFEAKVLDFNNCEVCFNLAVNKWSNFLINFKNLDGDKYTITIEVFDKEKDELKERETFLKSYEDYNEKNTFEDVKHYIWNIK